jgi:hypothetical protein
VSNVGVVTLHRSSSYGGTLQAYATYLVLRKLNFNVEFVNYTNKNEQSQDKWICYRSDRSFIENIRGTLRNILLLQPFYRNKSYKEFHSKLPTAKKKYNCITRMNKIKYDILLSGSDQLWNPLIFGELDPVFFLGFGQAKKKIAYAASMGSYKFRNNETIKVASYINNYTFISAREEHVVDEILKITGRHCPVVLDPTLLVSKQAWIKVLNIKTPKIKNYILLYLIGINGDYYRKYYAKIVKYYSKRTNLPVYYVSPDYRKVNGTDVALKGVTPTKFLELIRNASLVLTSSYHGIAFSINFGKKFVALQNPNNPIRLQFLLETFELNDQIVDNETTNYELPLKNIDYDKIHAKLSAQRIYSLQWLRRAMN